MFGGFGSSDTVVGSGDSWKSGGVTTLTTLAAGLPLFVRVLMVFDLVPLGLTGVTLETFGVVGAGLTRLRIGGGGKGHGSLQ